MDQPQSIEPAKSKRPSAQQPPAQVGSSHPQFRINEIDRLEAEEVEPLEGRADSAAHGTVSGEPQSSGRGPNVVNGPDRNRRHLLVGGSAIAVGAWITPSVITLDRIAAATGSCGAAPIQLDWSDYADNSTVPGSIIANDGTVVTIATSDPFSIGGPRNFTVQNSTYGGLPHFLAMEMVGGDSGDYVEVTFAFSNPVQLCFTLLDVDSENLLWQDTVRLNGTLSGSPVTVTAADVVTGPAVSLVANDTLRGILDNNTPASSPDANAAVTYPSPIDNLVVRYSDQTSWIDNQIIGLHDFLWC